MKENSHKILVFVFILALSSACSTKGHAIEVAEDIRLEPLRENVWIHISEIEIQPWGMVPANGLAVLTDDQLILVDTPWNDGQTQLLVEWFQDRYEISQVKVIVTHYHGDNLGGLNWIHQNGMESYSILKTQEICQEKEIVLPRNTLPESYRFDFDETALEIFFPGEGHTVDSICVYLPKEKILFGGCSVKALRNSTLGNTADANLQAWPESLENMKEKFPEAEIVIPGHGAEGDISLIDHTLSLF